MDQSKRRFFIKPVRGSTDADIISLLVQVGCPIGKNAVVTYIDQDGHRQTVREVDFPTVFRLSKEKTECRIQFEMFVLEPGKITIHKMQHAPSSS